MPTQNSKDIEDNKVIAAIGYIFILCFIPLLLAKDSKFAQFHGKQALALFIIDILVLIFNTVFGWVPIIGWLMALILSLGVILLSLIGMLKALNGEMWEMPIVSNFAKKINL